MIGTRARRPTIAMFVASPSSTKRFVWVLAGMMLMCFDAVELSLAPFGVSNISFFAWTRIVAIFFWSLDIIFSFLVGVVMENGIEMRPRQIAKHYLKTWFIFDVCVLAPDI